MWYDYDIVEYQVVHHIPQNAVQVDVVTNGFTWRVNSHHNTVAREVIQPLDQNIFEEIEQMDEWGKRLLKGMEMLATMEEISHPMNQQLIIASDGSVQDHKASYGWIVATIGGTKLIQCSGPAYGYTIILSCRRLWSLIGNPVHKHQ
jgi:hypothetical protein